MVVLRDGTSERRDCRLPEGHDGLCMYCRGGKVDVDSDGGELE